MFRTGSLVAHADPEFPTAAMSSFKLLILLPLLPIVGTTSMHSHTGFP